MIAQQDFFNKLNKTLNSRSDSKYDRMWDIDPAVGSDGIVLVDFIQDRP